VPLPAFEAGHFQRGQLYGDVDQCWVARPWRPLDLFRVNDSTPRHLPVHCLSAGPGAVELDLAKWSSRSPNWMKTS